MFVRCGSWNFEEKFKNEKFVRKWPSVWMCHVSWIWPPYFHLILNLNIRLFEFEVSFTAKSFLNPVYRRGRQKQTLEPSHPSSILYISSCPTPHFLPLILKLILPLLLRLLPNFIPHFNSSAWFGYNLLWTELYCTAQLFHLGIDFCLM